MTDQVTGKKSSRYTIATATIAAGESLSAPIDCTAGTPVFLFVPSNWTSAAATFQASPDGVDWFDLVDSTAAALTFNVAANTAVRLYPLWEPVTHLRIRSGLAGHPVQQRADAQIIVMIDTQAV